MSMTVEYRGYTISSIPVQQVRIDEWKPGIVISSQCDGVVTTQLVYGRHRVFNGRGRRSAWDYNGPTDYRWKGSRSVRDIDFYR